MLPNSAKTHDKPGGCSRSSVSSVNLPPDFAVPVGQAIALNVREKSIFQFDHKLLAVVPRDENDREPQVLGLAVPRCKSGCKVGH
jgi:hypothetical protein